MRHPSNKINSENSKTTLPKILAVDDEQLSALSKTIDFDTAEPPKILVVDDTESCAFHLGKGFGVRPLPSDHSGERWRGSQFNQHRNRSMCFFPTCTCRMQVTASP